MSNLLDEVTPEPGVVAEKAGSNDVRNGPHFLDVVLKDGPGDDNLLCGLQLLAGPGLLGLVIS